MNEDPILDIRKAVASTLVLFEAPLDHKDFTDAVVDALPNFFRQPLTSATDDAAPDLLAALKAAVDDVDAAWADGFEPPAWRQPALAAIAKARGEVAK